MSATVATPSKRSVPSAGQPPSPLLVPLPVVQADYQVTQDIIKTLTDIRFRLLGFVPVFSTVGVTLVTAQVFGPISPVSTIAVGLMGFFLTLGLLIYDLRNSGIYDGCIHRAKMLEGILNNARYPTDEAIWPPVLQASAPPPDPTKIKAPSIGIPGGAYRQRLPSYYRLLVPVKHDAALALIYGVALGAWAFPIMKGLAIVGGMGLLCFCDPAYAWFFCFRRQSGANGITTSLVALIISILSARLFYKTIFTADNPTAVTTLTDYTLARDKESDWNNQIKDTAWTRMSGKMGSYAIRRGLLKKLT